LKANQKRVLALKRFAAAATLFNIFGKTVLGFEQSWLQIIVSVTAGLVTELLLETVDAKMRKREARYKNQSHPFHFFLPAYVGSLTISMLIHAGDALTPFIFTPMIAMCSKYVFLAPIHGKVKHFLNPSAFGIIVAIVFLPNVGAAPPYQYIEYINNWQEVVLIMFLMYAGSFMNFYFTGRWPLVVAFWVGFVLQAVARTGMSDFPFLMANLLPVTGVAFIIFCFYMISDPGTTPSSKRGQIIFGLTTAAAYGVLQVANVVYGLFYALMISCALRGAYHFVLSWLESLELSGKSEMEQESALA